ncbi:MAG: TolC family protein [Pelomonas sp.]|nr:TolC family protein [Roseateles sp.]
MRQSFKLAPAAAALLAALLLAACAGAPPAPPEPPTPPAAWTAPPGAGASDASNAAWAPLLAPGLQELLAQSLAANTDIRRAVLTARNAALQARATGLRVTPSVGLSYEANRPLGSQATVNVDGVLVPAGPAAQWTHSYGASLGASFELDLWNRLAQLDAQQAALTEAARSDVAAARLVIADKVAEDFWTLAANERFAALAAAKLKLAEETLPLVSARVREGKLQPIEIDKAAAVVKSARQQLAGYEATAAKTRVDLAKLLDQAPPGPAVAAAALPDALPGWKPDAPGAVLERRPDVHGARLRVDAALAGARAQRAARYPQLTFSGGLATGGESIGNWFAQPLLSLASNLTVPLIDWRRLDLEDAQRRNDLETSALNLRDAVFGALGEVEGLLADQQRIAAEQSAAAQQLAQTRDAERIANLQLEVGTIARADALQARTATLDAELNLESARLDALLNRLALLRALCVEVPAGRAPA